MRGEPSYPPKRPDGAPRVGLALGAGGARGLAHVGVLQELAALDVGVDVLAGASMGALVSVSHAAGRLAALEATARRTTWLQIARMVDLNVNGGLVHTERLHDVLEQILGEAALEELAPSVTVVAADMLAGREVWLTEGPVIDAVSASIAMPGVFPPVHLHRRWLVDGAIVNPLPVAPVRAQNVDVIIAVNLSGPLWRVPARELHPRGAAGARPRLGWLAALGGRRTGTVRIEPLATVRDPRAAGTNPPGFADVVGQSVTVMQDTIARMRLAGDPCDVLLAPEVRHVGLFEFHRADELIAAGRAAVRAEADRLRELCRSG